MTLTTLKIPPGLQKDSTDYASKGGWLDSQWTRFRGAFPEKMGGWVKRAGPFLGAGRSLNNWKDLSLVRHVGIGTNAKFYVETNNALTDITPVRSTATLTNPFAVTSGSNIVTVTSTAHGALIGDGIVISGASAVGGLTLNGSWLIASVPTANTFTLIAPSNATSTATGGGSVTINYNIHAGATSVSTGSGWGAGGWGRGGWGSGATVTVAGDQIGLWSQGNYGEDLIINPRGQPIFYYDITTPTAPAVPLSTLSGAVATPLYCNIMLVSPEDRRVFAFGTNPYGATAFDPLLVRWSDAGSPVNWDESDIDRTAGEVRLGLGSSIVAALHTRSETLVWTDCALYTLRFIGGTVVFSLTLISPTIDIVGPNGAAGTGDFCAWMGRDDFFIYNGSSATLPCTVREKVFSDINTTQAYKINCGVNTLFREIWWFYPSSSSTENDSYVVFNYGDNTWYCGTLARLAWCDKGVFDVPMATGADNYLYFHESGLDDGSTSPSSPITAYIKTGPVELADGDHVLFLRKIIPDVTFAESTNPAPSLTYEVEPRSYPGEGPGSGDTTVALVIEATFLPYETFTPRCDVRMRGRYFCLKISSNALGVMWRLGLQKFDVQPDGMRV